LSTFKTNDSLWWPAGKKNRFAQENKKNLKIPLYFVCYLYKLICVRTSSPHRAALESDFSAEETPSAFGYRDACALAWPVEASSSVVAPTSTVGWHVASHDHFWLITTGSATMGHAGQLFPFEGGTLFFSRRGETQGFWNRSAATRLWVLKFEVTAAGSVEFHELLDLPPEERILKLSAAQQQLFCDILLKIAFAKSAQDRLSAATASAWLTIQLVNITRWVSGRKDNLSVYGGEVDLQCFELWQKIHRYACHTRSAEPMQFSKDPAYDSLRHRFQKLFGISPRGLLVRLRMERAKELLRTTNISVKQIAQELGYSKQHEFTRAFHRFSGMSPNKWKRKADAPCSALDFSSNGTSDDSAIGLQDTGSPESKKARIRYHHSSQTLSLKAGSEMVVQSRHTAPVLATA
jgi:hypothetical protein